MGLSLNPQEIYLLERFSSVDYFGELKDTWEKMVNHVEGCLTAFMRDIPSNYRSRRLPEQPDVVWGERVLPNFRDTLHGLYSGFILLSQGDIKGLNYAHGPENDFKGQMEYWSGWMSTADMALYHDLLIRATTMAGNICATEGGYWHPLELSDFSEERGPLNRPLRWPAYHLNNNVLVASGEKTKQAGIYVPDVGNSCAEFLSTEYTEAPRALVLVGIDDLLHPVTREKYGEQPVFEKQSCVWYLVERADDDVSTQLPPNATPVTSQRVPAGEVCSEPGFYFTPARAGSRQFFEKGEVMPALDTTYGATIWQWDSNQT